MKYRQARHCLNNDLLQFVRDQRPTERVLLTWLGTAAAGRYHVLRKAGLLALHDGKVTLAPAFHSPDGRRFYYENRCFHIDRDCIDVYCVNETSWRDEM